MRTYARIQNGIVAELLRTDGDVTSMFNPALVWVDVSSQTDVNEGWCFDGKNFTAAARHDTSAQAPSIAELQAQLAALSAQLAALSGTS
jgi:hypothetical protein